MQADGQTRDIVKLDKINYNICTIQLPFHFINAFMSAFGND